MILRHVTLNNPVVPLMQNMERVFDSLASQAMRSEAAPAFVPALNLWQSDTAFIVEAELPGFRMEDIEVSVLQNRLTISGRRQEQDDQSRGEYIRRERRFGEFSRTLTMPAQIDGEMVEAHLEHGVLRITLPKAQAAQPKRIEVRSAK